LASRQRPDGVAAVPPCPQTAVFANPGGSGVTPTEKEEAIMRIAARQSGILPETGNAVVGNDARETSVFLTPRKPLRVFPPKKSGAGGLQVVSKQELADFNVCAQG